MEKTFNAYVIEGTPGNSQGAVRPFALADLDAGEVLIRGTYASVNYKDALAGTGKGAVVRRFPLIGGLDVAGEVVESADSRFSPGHAVIVHGFGMGVDHHGSYAQYIRVPADWVLPLPQGLTPFDAMAIGSAGFTAAYGLERLMENGLAPGNGRVVVTGATGGVGSMAIDLLAAQGYTVTAITGKREQEGYLRELGAQEIWGREQVQASGRPLEKPLWAGAFDSVGGDTLAWLLRTTQLHGAIACYGLAGGSQFCTTVIPFLLRGVSLIGLTSANCPMPRRIELWRRLAGDWRPRHLQQMVHTISLDALNATFEDMLAGRLVGRVVVDLSR